MHSPLYRSCELLYNNSQNQLVIFNWSVADKKNKTTNFMLIDNFLFVFFLSAHTAIGYFICLGAYP